MRATISAHTLNFIGECVCVAGCALIKMKSPSFSVDFVFSTLCLLRKTYQTNRTHTTAQKFIRHYAGEIRIFVERIYLQWILLLLPILFFSFSPFQTNRLSQCQNGSKFLYTAKCVYQIETIQIGNHKFHVQ